jgi:hypothetical protein
MAIAHAIDVVLTDMVASAAASCLFQNLIHGRARSTRCGLFSWATGVAVSGRAPHLED